MYQSGIKTNHSTDFCMARLADFVLTGMDKQIHTMDKQIHILVSGHL